MLYAFIDESYTKDRYYVSAYVVDEDQLQAIKAALALARDYAQGFGIPPEAEFHGYEIMSGRGLWKPIRGQHRAATAIYRRALERIAAVPTGRLFIQGLDIPRLNARYRYPEPPHRIALRHVLEDVDRVATGRQEQVLVIEDEVPDQVAHLLRMDSYQRSSTGGVRPRTLSTIQMPITFGSSAQSPGLQAADLAVYLYRRMDAHVEAHEVTRAVVEDLWQVLRPLKPVARRWDP